MDTSESAYEYTVRAAPYSDGSGFAATAVIEPGDDGAPAVRIDVRYRLTVDGWAELKTAIDNAMALASGGWQRVSG